MDYIVCLALFFAGTITVSIDKTVADMDIKLKPQAEKLTISIDSVAARIPPQIAYFIPDQLFNGTNFGNLNPNDPTIINMWPPNTPQNNSNSRNSTFQMNVSDMMMSSQRPYRYFAVASDEDVNDSEAALQNYNYQVDFAKLPDKKPDFRRFEQLYRKREPVNSSGKLKKKKHTKRPIAHSSEPLYNYANNSPNVRGRIKVIKMNVENKFGNSKEDEPQSESNGSSEEYDGESIERFKFLKTNGKSKKNQHKNHHHRNDKERIVMKKLSQPQSSVENESNPLDYDNSNDESNENGSDRSDYDTDHENCDDRQHRHRHHQRANLVNQQPQDDQDYDTDVQQQQIPSARDPRKGYSIYLTKVTKRPLRIDRTQNARIHFVPTRMLSTVRAQQILVRKPRKGKKPYRGKVSESGGHMVYTEDGFEDANYDHGNHHKNHEYSKRTRRATDYNKLRGQELIDHLETLIRNVSDYLNSSEIVPNTDKKYPLYNSSNENIGNSVIKYSEYAKPVVDNEHSSELYESKTKECEEIEEPDFSNAGNYNDTNQPKKRLGKLGASLKCLKEKLFGAEPLDNPLFNEENIAEPEAKNVLGSSINAANGISVVYTDVMDNIKKNAFNENQRIFSNYDVTENFAIGTINTQQKHDGELNTSEQYPEKPVRSKYSSVYKRLAQVSESPLSAFNVFNNPVQVPILDISKFIPTPHYPTEEDFVESDFRPIVSPYHIQTEVSTTSTTTIAPTSKKVIPERVQGKKPLQFHYETLNSNVHFNYIPPNFNPHIQRAKPNSNRKYQNPNINSNVKFNPVGQVIPVNLVHQNVNRNQSPPPGLKIIRRRLPAQIVRVFPAKV